jgi:DNA-binding response OmpR family regulator
MIANPCVLVIDDDSSIQELISAVLIDEGYRVIATTHRRVTLDLLGEYAPDLILVDFPRLFETGDLTILVYRNSLAYPLPLVLLTTAINPECLMKRLNANAFLQKPFDIEELITIVSSQTPAFC